MAIHKVSRICKWCNKPFKVWPAHLRKRPAKFCSNSCYHSFMRSVHVPRCRPRRCRQCHAIVLTFVWFCSRTCRQTYMDKAISGRFWSKVTQGDSCWTWAAGYFSDGYGAFCRNGQNVHAHRVAYELTYGRVPKGLVVRHKCDNPPCVRPDHLESGTPADNSHDMVERGRSAKRK